MSTEYVRSRIRDTSIDQEGIRVIVRDDLPVVVIKREVNLPKRSWQKLIIHILVHFI